VNEARGCVSRRLKDHLVKKGAGFELDKDMLKAVISKRMGLVSLRREVSSVREKFWRESVPSCRYRAGAATLAARKQLVELARRKPRLGLPAIACLLEGT